MSNYFRIEEEAKLRFFRMPKALFYEERYKGLSSNSKILYAILTDRKDLSVKNNWVDEEGKIYIIYRLDKKSVSEEDNNLQLNDEDDNLVDLTGWTRPTIRKYLKELASVDLIEIKVRGNNKANIMYLKKVQVDNPKNYFDDSYKNSFYSFLEEDIKEQLKIYLSLDGNKTDFNIINELAKKSAIDQVEILSKVFNTKVERINQFMIILDTSVEDGTLKSAKNSIGYFKYLIKLLSARA